MFFCTQTSYRITQTLNVWKEDVKTHAILIPSPYLPQAHKDPYNNKKVGAGTCTEWWNYVENCDWKHGNSNDFLGTNSLSQTSSRYLQKQVTPEERSQNKTLKFLVPCELTWLNKRLIFETLIICCMGRAGNRHCPLAEGEIKLAMILASRQLPH